MDGQVMVEGLETRWVAWVNGVWYTLGRTVIRIRRVR